MNLYEINNELLKCVDEETGEIISYDLFNELNLKRNEKIEQIALWYKNEKSNAESYKREKEVFAKREKIAKNKAKSLKKWLYFELQGSEFKTDKVLIKYRKSESVEISENAKLSDEYLTFEEPKPNKLAIKTAIKNGTNIIGCALVENQNIQIT